MTHIKLVKIIKPKSLVVLLFCCMLGESLAPRTPYDIPLVRIKAGNNESDKDKFKHVQVLIDGTKEYAIITRYHDTYVKSGRHGTKRTTYQEPPGRAFIISEFEAEQLDRVVESFTETLKKFERDLKRRNWGKCRYLDAFFPRFFKRFYFLVCAARNSTHALPRISNIPASKYDVSLNSPKSDRRIDMWREKKDHIVKLRIISKELIYQLNWWQKKELDNSRRNPEIAYSAKAEEAYKLFIRLYFNLHPPPLVPPQGKHL